jgi:DNA replication protein DnaC
VEFLDLYDLVSFNEPSSKQMALYLNEKCPSKTYEDKIRISALQDKLYSSVCANIPFLYLQWFLESKAYPKKAQEVLLSTDHKEIKPSNKVEDINESIIKPALKNLDTFLNKGYSLLFFGANGGGKTYSALLLLFFAIQSKRTGYYINSRELQSLYNKANYSSEATELDKKRLQCLIDCDLLVIDEVGKEIVTANYISSFEYLLKQRNSNLKSTILCTNLTIVPPDAQDSLYRMYGNSVFNLLMERYRCFWFSKDNNMRTKTRVKWEI